MFNISVLFLILARGGSKRLPGKNIKILGDAPLIVWSINQALALQPSHNVLVSTDCPVIANEAKQAGAYVPWLRPAKLATDASTSIDACLHAIAWYETTHECVDGVVLLQPTSPFRTVEYLTKGIEHFIENDRRPVVGFSPAKTHPYWCFQKREQKIVPFFQQANPVLSSQILPPAYQINGAFYMCTPEHLRKERSFFSDDLLPFVSEEFIVSLDIDTEWDWMMAEALVKKYQLSAVVSGCMREA